MRLGGREALPRRRVTANLLHRIDRVGWGLLGLVFSIPVLVLVLYLAGVIPPSRRESNAQGTIVWIALFGGSWLFLVVLFPGWKWRAFDVLELTSEGIEMRRVPKGRRGEIHTFAFRPQVTTTADAGFVSWRDVEEIGVFRWRGSSFTGVRLLSAERFLASQDPRPARKSPDDPVWFQRVVLGLKALMVMHGIVTASLVIIGGSQEEGEEEKKRKEEEGTRREQPSALLVERRGALEENRRVCGYELVFGRCERDRSARRFQRLLELYRTAAVEPSP